MVWKVASERIINLDAEKIVFTVKIIDLDTEVGLSVVKTILGFGFEIDGDGRHIEMALTVLL